MKRIIQSLLVLSLIINSTSFTNALKLPDSVYRSPNQVKGSTDLTVTYRSKQPLPINCSCFPDGKCPPVCGKQYDGHVYITLYERPYYATIKYGDDFKCYGNRDPKFKMDFIAQPVYDDEGEKIGHPIGKGDMIARHNFIHWYSSYPMKNKSFIINHTIDWKFSCPKSIQGKIIQDVIGNCYGDSREPQKIEWLDNMIKDIYIFETQNKGAQAWGKKFSTYGEGAIHPFAHERPHLYMEALEDYRLDGDEPQLIDLKVSMCGTRPWSVVSFQPWYKTQPESLKR